MNAPVITTQLEPRNVILAHDKLIASPTNPRKRKGLDIASLTELAQTMRPPIGILQPILVRELVPGTVNLSYTLANEGKFEIIAGERRWRAAKIAKLENVPVIIRQLSDIEVLKIQLIENKQRTDLDELEEAEGYEKLMKQVDAKGAPYTVDTIAEAMGVSRATIYARLKLLALCQEAREAFYKGKLDASRALLIARIPVHKLQIKALNEILKEAEWGTSNIIKGEVAMSYRKARDHIQENYMTDLDRAAFDIKDATLLPKSGSCIDCPSRTGNAGELFSDVQNKDVCTDPHCFALKKVAHVKRIQDEAAKRGDTVITGNAAKKIITNNYSDQNRQLEEHGYAALDAKIPDDDKGRTWGQALKEKKLLANAPGLAPVNKTIIEIPNKPGVMIQSVSIEQATKALREAGFNITLRNDPSASTNKIMQRAAQEKEQAAKKEKVDAANAYRARLFETLHKKIADDVTGSNMNGLYCLLAEFYFDEIACNYNSNEDAVLRVVKMYIPDLHDDEDIGEAMMQCIPKLTVPQQFLLLVDLMLSNELEHYNPKEQPETMLHVAKEIGVDAKAIEKQVADEIKASKKSAAKPKASAKPAEKKAVSAASKPASTPTPIPTPAAPAAALADRANPTLKPRSDLWPFPTPGVSKPSSTPIPAAPAAKKGATKKTAQAPRVTA